MFREIHYTIFNRLMNNFHSTFIEYYNNRVINKLIKSLPKLETILKT